jgi:DNA polymerase-3 subunit beta
MKVEVLKENLKNSLSVTEKIVGKNLSLPILDNVLINTEENFLNINSTNLETAIKIWVLAKIIKPGNVVVPAKFLSSFVSSLPNDKIILDQKGLGLHIDCKNYKTDVQGFNPEDFPIIPEFKDAEIIEIDNKKLCQGLSQVVDIASISQSRPEISGIYFNFSKNTVKMVATDSFRLAEKNITLDTNTKRDFSFIIPQKPAKEIINILSDKEGGTRIYVLPNQVMFEFLMKEFSHPEVQIISRLIEGEYPNYQEIIPVKFKTEVVLKRDEFSDQIKTASLFSGKLSEIKIGVNPEKNEVEIFAQDPEIGQNRSNIVAKCQGEPMEISFNYKFLTDGLMRIKSSEISFSISSQEGACLLRPVGDSSYTYVVMPIRS